MSCRFDRIVIDECHIVLNQNGQFRPVLSQLGKFRSAATQMILLTATLPPSMEPELCRRMQWSHEQVVWHRSRTSRGNIAYRIHSVAVSPTYDDPMQWIDMPEVIAVIQSRVRQAGAGRTIVYGSITRHVTGMAEHLGCAAFYSKAVDKDGMLAGFRQTPG